MPSLFIGPTGQYINTAGPMSQKHKIDGKTYLFSKKITEEEAHKRIAEKKAKVDTKPSVEIIRKDLLDVLKKSIQIYKKTDIYDVHKNEYDDLGDRTYVMISLDDKRLTGNLLSGEVKQLEIGGDGNLDRVILRWNADTGFIRWRIEPKYKTKLTFEQVLSEAIKEVDTAKFFNDAEGLKNKL